MTDFPNGGAMEVDAGHIYAAKNLGNDEKQIIVFRKANSGSIEHPQEWAGLTTQQLYRIAIWRSIYLDNIRTCNETTNAIYHSRMALWEYEARAYRRKIGRTNKQGLDHPDDEREREWRHSPANDIPFGIENIIDGEIIFIEDLPIGDDGHIHDSIVSQLISNNEMTYDEKRGK